MADEQQFQQDLKIINLNRFNKFDKPPTEPGYSRLAVSIFSNGKIRFNVSQPDNKFFGASVYPFELAVIKDKIIPIFTKGIQEGMIKDFKAVINVESVDYKTKVVKSVLMIVGSKDSIPYIGFKDNDNKAVFPFKPINKVTMEIDGGEITDEQVAIIYAKSYFSDLLNSVDKGFESFIAMGMNVTTLGNGNASQESTKVSNVMEDDVI